MVSHLKRWFIYGLLIWVPIGVTVFVVRFLFDLFDKLIDVLPVQYQPHQLLGFGIPGLGLVIAILLLILTGIVTSNLIGRSLIGWAERLIGRVPFIRAIYGSAKQVAQTLLASDGQGFRQAVLVPYPYRGCYSLGFITATHLGEVQDKTGTKVTAVFVPTTPNPTSGFILLVPDEDVIALEMTVDEALKMIISIGVVVPEWPRKSTLQTSKKEDHPRS